MLVQLKKQNLLSNQGNQALKGFSGAFGERNRISDVAAAPIQKDWERHHNA